MAWITTILGAAAGGELREAYLKVRAVRGDVASIFQVHGVHPQVATTRLEHHHRSGAPSAHWE